jgi:hypothetical protein
MKRISALGLALALAGFGCLGSGDKQPEKPPPVNLAAQEPAAVMADEITDRNAVEKARLLREELEFDAKKRGVAEPE